MLTLAALPLALLASHTSPLAASAPEKLSYLANLDYSNNRISVYSSVGGKAKLMHRFTLVDPSTGSVNGIQLGGNGMIYTAVNSSSGNPCASCIEMLQLNGKLVTKIDAPTISGAPGQPDITDIALDEHSDVFASDIGQQAVYYYASTASGYTGPNLVVSGTSDAASVAVMPSAHVAYVSGGCGFASARVFTRQPSGGYQPGNCFGIGTIALIGASVDGSGNVASPVDGAAGVVSISDPKGKGRSFRIPTSTDAVSGVSFSRDGKALYVADATKGVVYEYLRPESGWVTRGRKPRLLATITGFSGLDIIATV
jgi:hypothetical protein